MAAPVPAGFVITLEHLIYGFGSTEAAAFAYLRQEMANAGGIRIVEAGDEDADEAEQGYGEAPPLRLSACRVWPATAALLAAVETRGGDIDWHECGGVACTKDEAGE